MANFSVTENYGTYQGETSYILDGSTSNVWRGDATNAAGKYVLVTSDVPIHVTTVVYSTTQTSEVFKSGTYLQYSSDGTNFTDAGQFSGSSSATFTVDADCQYIRIYCKSGSGYISISELAISYEEVSTITHTITVEAGDGVTVDKLGENEVKENRSFELNIEGSIKSITDNGVDVLSSVVEHTVDPTGTVSSNPTAYATTETIKGTNYQKAIGNASSNTASGNDYSSSSSSTATITYSFDFSSIPENATIKSVSVVVGGHLENTSRSTANLQLYSGSTAKGSQTKFTSTSKQLITMEPGSWTRSELQEAKLQFTIGYYGGLINGVDFDVEYEIAGSDVYYTYTISAVTESHQISINLAVSEDSMLRFKMDGVYKVVKKVYKKVNGVYVEIEATTLSTNTRYINKT